MKIRIFRIAIIMQKIEQNKISWINLANPNFEDLTFLEKDLNTDLTVLKELLEDNKRPKIEEYENYIFLVIHFPVFDKETCQTTPTELDFVVTRDSVITVYQKANPVLEKLFEDIKNDERRKREYFKSAGWLLFCILDRLIDSCLPMLDHIHDKIENIEQQVFEGKEREMLKEIAILKRDIIDFRRTIKPQRSILEVLGRKTNRFFKAEEPEIISQEIIGSEIRVWNTLENHKEMIEAIEQTNSNLFSYQISRVMHTLTYFSILLFSLTFIAGFFSMKVAEDFLFIRHYTGLYIVMGIMLAVVIFITVLFKKKKWL